MNIVIKIHKILSNVWYMIQYYMILGEYSKVSIIYYIYNLICQETAVKDLSPADTSATILIYTEL